MNMKIPSPLPRSEDKMVYWLLAAVAGALIGGYVFNTLNKADPL